VSQSDIKTKKLCFVYCGEQCNCEIGMDWSLNDDAKEQIRKIEENTILARQRL
jgi:hypothetical protein